MTPPPSPQAIQGDYLCIAQSLIYFALENKRWSPYIVELSAEMLTIALIRGEGRDGAWVECNKRLRELERRLSA